VTDEGFLPGPLEHGKFDPGKIDRSKNGAGLKT